MFKNFCRFKCMYCSYILRLKESYLTIIKWKLNLKRFIQSKLAATQSFKMSGFSNPKYKL